MLSSILLDQSRSDQAISNDVLEILGFEEIELVSEVVQDRWTVGRELVAPTPTPSPRPNLNISETPSADVSDNERLGKGKRKGKGKGKHNAERGRGFGHVPQGNDMLTSAPIDFGRVNFTAADAKRRMEESLQAAGNRPLYTGTAVRPYFL